MNNQLFIPKKLKVGYNKREDTYSKKLAYVIYYDNKGVLRKETSWKGWIQKAMGIDEFDNEPLEGFVINKKVGGTAESYSWNARQEYARVFDPRGFEIEITVPNLLYILQECNCYKGKGLEGTFVYSWDGKQLVLLPTCSAEYAKCTNYTALQSKKIGAKTLIPGCSYKTKKEEDLIYLGKFDHFQNKYIRANRKHIIKSSKKFIFYDKNKYFIALSALETLAAQNTDTPVDEYASLVESYTNSVFNNAPVGLVDEPITKAPDIPTTGYWSENFFEKISENKYAIYQFYYTNNKQGPIQVTKYCNLIFKDGQFETDYCYNTSNIYPYKNHYQTYHTVAEAKKKIEGLLKVYVKLSNGKKVLYKNYKLYN